jgi:hypothetical protein
MAATFTTPDAIDWLLLFLCEHPDIQDKCYNEIKEQLAGKTPTPVYPLPLPSSKLFYISTLFTG